MRHARRAPDRDRRAAARRRADGRACATVTYAPTRVLDGLKTLSYAAQHARRAAREGAGLRRGAARHAARPRARGPDVDVLLGRRRRAAARRRWRTASSPRSRARGVLERVRRRASAPCTLDDVRARRGGVHRLDRARGDADRRGRRDRAAGRARPVDAARERSARVARELQALRRGARERAAAARRSTRAGDGTPDDR